MDEIDRANDLAEKELRLRLQALHEREKRLPIETMECEMCGDTIPAKRRLAVPGCSLCVYCRRET